MLRDLLAAGSLPAVRLTKIFRQAQQSGIVVNAHRVNAGQTAELVTDIVARRIPARFGLDPRRDVQVLCPMHRGPAGGVLRHAAPQPSIHVDGLVCSQPIGQGNRTPISDSE